MRRVLLFWPLWVVSSLLAAQQDPPAGSTAPAKSAAETAPDEWIGGAPWWAWSRATGNWNGYRTMLAERGIEIAGGYTSDWAAAWKGGASRSGSYSSLLDVNAAFDLDVLCGLANTRAYIDIYAIQGADPTSHIGDFQGVSNVQASDRTQIAEVWLETQLLETLRLKVGKVDFNSEFGFTEIGGEFVNSSAAISPTIVGYPTYPDPAMSANVFWKPNERFYLGGGIYDGATAEGHPTGRRGISGFFDNAPSDAYLLAVEAGTTWTGGEHWGSGRLALGGWHHTGDFTTFGGNARNGASGVYLVLDQKLWRENPGTEDDNQGLAAFGSFGLTDDHVADCGSNAVLGVTWIGALDGRDHDVIGFAVLYANLSDSPGAGYAEDETALELFYKLQLTPCFSVKPELQWIRSPSGDPAIDDALVGLLRFELNF